ncbi:hypothetical protein DFH29DRAFT_1002346 [Suillus ampliporus]|nr:hypothetical protein DFH29DRAFT_1002346 [Suillus ampliporus]
MDVGALTPSVQGFEEREMLIERVSGARLHAPTSVPVVSLFTSRAGSFLSVIHQRLNKMPTGVIKVDKKVAVLR